MATAEHHLTWPHLLYEECGRDCAMRRVQPFTRDLQVLVDKKTTLNSFELNETTVNIFLLEYFDDSLAQRT